MKDGDLKISMEKEKQVVVEQTGMQVMSAVAGNADTVSAGSGSFNGKQEQQEECQPEGKDSKGSWWEPFMRLRHRMRKHLSAWVIQ